MIAQHFSVSEKEAKEYIEIYFDQDLNELKTIIKKYGKTDKEVEKLLKNEKN
jgi:DNA polymerase I-like protein with 3'-5' exonuclease and polymerase domains